MKQILMLTGLFSSFAPTAVFATDPGVTKDKIDEFTGDRIIWVADLFAVKPYWRFYGGLEIHDNYDFCSFVMSLSYLPADQLSIDHLSIKTDNGAKSFDLTEVVKGYYFDMSRKILQWMLNTKTIKMRLEDADNTDFVVRDSALKSLKSFEQYMKTKAPIIWEKL